MGVCAALKQNQHVSWFILNKNRCGVYLSVDERDRSKSKVLASNGVVLVSTNLLRSIDNESMIIFRDHCFVYESKAVDTKLPEASDAV